MDFKNKKLFLLDMDGTLYLDETLFPDVPEFLALIKERGGRYMFLTNNSSKGTETYIEKMARLGIKATAGDFLTSTDATVEYMKKNGYIGKKIYAFGTKSFRTQIKDAGFNITTELEDGIDLLLCGYDTELTYRKLEDACILLGRGVDYIATHPDWVCPTSYGYAPDLGSVCEMLFRATGRRPFVIGKPQPGMVRAALSISGFEPEEAVMIGDRIYTDVASGRNAGIDAVLVLSGETTLEAARMSDVVPTAIMRDISEIYGLMKQ